ncbi:putative flavin-nucleotide-binding protein [Vibrio sinaloensis DSM 21326]|uniref:Putative flavin-nucleotide-binding protein n=1 Tax=Vibrio sinaloensis DSM 21326 TaxID=945550 RepID=E8MBC8_PHOS4|nr:pyridoxamine 5'-phosphate oxidase family protein [Vibrio sinaloensis]EGA68711.1 putative flavin-nucleotide-binding protein [Vibrio sinaloensis DSM 21326]
MLSTTKRSQVNKAQHKAVLDTEVLNQIIDESLIGHIAIVEHSGPVIIPMLAWRVDDHIYIHGANNSRLMRSLKQGAQTCVTFTLFDGWVLARSAFHHSAHYRSAVVFGGFEQVENKDEKDRVLNYFIEHIAPGRTQQVRLSSDKELAATLVLKMPLSEASVKVSNYGVNDDRADLDLPVWAGVLPYRTVVGPLEPVEACQSLEEPDYSAAYTHRWYT